MHAMSDRPRMRGDHRRAPLAACPPVLQHRYTLGAHFAIYTCIPGVRSTFLLFMLVFTPLAQAAEWPTYQSDNHRSGVAREVLPVPLAQVWDYDHGAWPDPAWEGPAKWDAYSTRTNLKSMRNFDPVFYVTVAEGRVYFGSSVTDAAHCLDAATGEELWAYYTDGAVRFPPTCDQGKVYFGSDDGHVYCVTADTGDLVWRYDAADGARNIPVNGKLMSIEPVRTGVLVDDGVAYFGASLLPWRPSYLCALNTADGAVKYRQEHKGIVLQGSLLLSKDNLYALQGRSAPIVFSRATGEKRGVVGGAGGIFAIITDEDTFISGSPSQKEDRFAESPDQGGDQLAFYENAQRLIVHRGIAYLQADGKLKAFDRARYLEVQAELKGHNQDREKLEKDVKALDQMDLSDAERKARKDEIQEKLESVRAAIEGAREAAKACYRWQTACDMPHGMILTGNTLIAGGDGTVGAFAADTGEPRWTAQVDGAAHGLAVAEGRLFVSTDTGHIYGFQAE